MAMAYMKTNKKTENILEILRMINFQEKENFELQSKGSIIKANL